MSGSHTRKPKKNGPDRQPLPGQQDLPFYDEVDASSNGRAPAPNRRKASTPKTDPGAGAKPPTSKLLSAAKRVRDFKREGRGLTRQLDIQLRLTPIPEIPFRVWPNRDDEYPVAILRIKTAEDR